MKASARPARGPSSAFETRRRLLLVGGVAALILVALVAGFTASNSDQILRRQAEYRNLTLAYQVGTVATQYVAGRRREATALASNPAVVRAAIEAGRLAVQQGLDRETIPALEQRFAAQRMLGGPADLEGYIRRYPTQSDMAEVFFTERHGLTVMASAKTSDFVQSDEEWWRMAMRDGFFAPEASFDSSAGVVSLELDVAIRALPTDEPVGVLKAVFGLTALSTRLEAGNLGGGTYLQVVDQGGRLLVAPGARQLLAPLPQGSAIQRTSESTVQIVPTATGDELVVATPANGGAWWVVLRQPVTQAFVAATTTKRAIWLAAGALLLLTIGAVILSAAWLHRVVTRPVRALGLMAGQVSQGDLTVEIGEVDTPSGESADLAHALATMVTELRQLVGGMQVTAADAAAMAEEISAATEEMSASTEEVASTTADLTERATRQAGMVRRAAEDAARIQGIIEELAVGANEAAERNASLALLAGSHREELDRSTAELVRLTEEIERGAEEAEALAASSNEIEQFVTQTKAIAKQTHMLALNAAIEAARGGGEGRGFTVVAEEVRKLAAQAARAAGSTSDTVQSVLERVGAARERLLRLAQGGMAARDAAHSAAEGLRVVAEEAEMNDQWTRAISESAGEVRTLVEGIADRMKAVAASTEEYAAAAQQIAAASEELNASTEEIASSAGHLATAAERLNGAVGGFRLPAPPQRTDPAPH